MSARRRMTIKEVAQAAGVSTQTVSRVLNNRPDVAADTYDRVQRIIADTGYAPNLFARSLTQGRSHILGVVAYGFEYFGPSRLLTGIEQQAADTGYAISLNLIHRPETADVDEVINELIGRQVDGIIWAIPEVGGNRAWSHEHSPDLPVPVTLLGRHGRRDVIGRRSASTTGRSAVSPPSTWSPAGRGMSPSSPDRSTGGRHRSGSRAGARPSTPTGSANRTGASSRVTGARRAASAHSCRSWRSSRTSTRCSRATTRWRSESYTVPIGQVDGSPTTYRSSASTTSPSPRTSGRR